MFEKYSNNKIDDIFIIRSSTRLFPLVINELKKTFPKARMSCLTNQKVCGQRSPLQYDVDHVIELPHTNGFRWRDIPVICQMVKPRTYDLAVVLYNSEKGFGYLNVDTIAFSVRPKLIVNVTIGKNVRRITLWTLVYKYFHRIIDLLWASINVVMTGLVSIIIFLAMVLSVPFVITRSSILKRLGTGL